MGSACSCSDKKATAVAPRSSFENEHARESAVQSGNIQRIVVVPPSPTREQRNHHQQNQQVSDPGRDVDYEQEQEQEQEEDFSHLNDHQFDPISESASMEASVSGNDRARKKLPRLQCLTEKRDLISLSTTPVGPQAQEYKYFCPICFLHFKG